MNSSWKYFRFYTKSGGCGRTLDHFLPGHLMFPDKTVEQLIEMFALRINYFP